MAPVRISRFFPKSLCFLFVIIVSLAFAKDPNPRDEKDYEEGMRLLKDDKFKQARPYFFRLVKKYPNFPGLDYKLGYCYYASGDSMYKAPDHFNRAKSGIAKGISLTSNDLKHAPHEAYYLAGKVAIMLEKYDIARQNFSLYKRIDSVYGTSGQMSARRRDEIETIMERTHHYKLFVKELFPYYVRKLDKASTLNVQDTNPLLLPTENNKEGKSIFELSITKTLYENDGELLRRCVVPESDARDGLSEVISRGYIVTYACSNYLIFKKFQNYNYDLFMSTRENGKWKAPEKLSISEPGSNETSAFFSPDQKKIYFVSDQGGGLGGYDVWSSTYNEKRKRWNSPENAGVKINTAADEISISPGYDQNKFYFSSDRSTGLGGFDIYESNLESSGSFTTPKALKYPVNSGGDDLDFISETKNYSLFSSNRGARDAEIYYIDYTTPVKVVQLVGNVPDEAISKTTGAHTDVVVFEDLVNVIEKIKNSDLKTAVKTIEEMDTKKAVEVVGGLDQSQAVSIVEGVNAETRNELVDGMEIEKAVDIVDAVSMSTAVDVIGSISDVKSIKIMENMESKKALTIMNQLDVSKASEILEGMEVEKAVDVIDEFTTSKAIDVIDQMDPVSAAAIMNGLDEAKAIKIIEGVGVEKAVEVLGKIDEERATKIVDRFKESIGKGQSEVEESKIIAILKSYFADQVKVKQFVIFKTVYFDFNSHELLLLTKQELLILVSFMNENKNVKIEVVGHTDNIGDWDSNLKISHDRSNEVFRFLRANKIEKERVIFYGKGPTSPIATNDTDEGRQQNRRVEVVLLQ